MVWMLAVFGLIAIISAYFYAFFKWEFLPFEDAAMLMRYARHLAEGHGIVWNIGEAPVDGATDFLFMVIVALFHKLGFSIEHATRFPVIICHLAVVFLVFHSLVKRQQAPLFIGLVFALYIGIGPSLAYIEAYFGTPVFALAGLLSWLSCIRMTFREKPSHTDNLAFALFALTMGLIRPEGVLLAGLMMLASVYYTGWKRSKKSLLTFIVVFGTLGSAYFFWRWSYFGYPLPNPFYVKGGGRLHLLSLTLAILFIIRMAWPFLLIWGAAWVDLVLKTFRKKKESPDTLPQQQANKPKTKQLIFYMMPVLGFTLIWILLSSEMNYFMRFQYVLLPMMAVSTYPFIPEAVKSWKSWKLVFVVLAIAMIGWQHISYGTKTRFFPNGMQVVAERLAPYADQGYTMVTTETGLLPLYSKWNAVDSYGLNDQHIAHKGLVDHAYLAEKQAELIVIHESWPDASTPKLTGVKAWLMPKTNWRDMVKVVKDYAEKGNYKHVAAFGVKPNDLHHYYVLKSCPASEEIAAIIQSTNYPWYKSGERCKNYAIPSSATSHE